MSRECITNYIKHDLPNAVTCLAETWTGGDAVGIKDAVTEIRGIINAVEA